MRPAQEGGGKRKASKPVPHKVAKFDNQKVDVSGVDDMRGNPWWSMNRMPPTSLYTGGKSSIPKKGRKPPQVQRKQAPKAGRKPL